MPSHSQLLLRQLRLDSLHAHANVSGILAYRYWYFYNCMEQAMLPFLLGVCRTLRNWSLLQCCSAPLTLPLRLSQKDTLVARPPSTSTIACNRRWVGVAWHATSRRTGSKRRLRSGGSMASLPCGYEKANRSRGSPLLHLVAACRFNAPNGVTSYQRDS